MENKAHAFAAGLFVLVVTALLIAMAAWLTRDTGIHRDYEISSGEAVNGLQPQAAVRYRGVAVGKVTDIGFDPQTAGNVLVRISVDDSAPITQSTFATLGFQGVTGLAFVQLDDTGVSKTALVAANGAPARIPMRPGLLSKLSDQGVAILTQLEQTSQRVNLLLSPENQKQLMATVSAIGQTAGSVQQLSAKVQQLSGTFETVLNAQLGPERVNFPQFVTEATATFKTVQKNSDGIDQTAAEFKKTASELTRVAERLNAQGGVLDRMADGAAALTAAGQSFGSATLPRLNRTSEEAARTARQLSRTASVVSDNPQSLIFGNGLLPPGPGEAGFTFPKGAQ